MALDLDRPEADTMLLACTNWQTLPIIAPLEARLGKPVVTTTQASLHAILGALNVPATVSRLGRLFDVARKH
jgi:maleate cis-trans isomerase